MRKRGMELISVLGLRLKEDAELFAFLKDLLEKSQADYFVVKDAKSGNLFRIPFNKEVLADYSDLVDWLMAQKS